MLVLSRHEQESIVIGDDILITVVAIGRGVARIGIEAPRGVRVDRSELRDRIDRERAEAAGADLDPRRAGRAD